MSTLLLLAADAPSEQQSAPSRVVEPRDVIALEAGIWDAQITIPPRTPGGTPTTATGVQVNEARSGGLWMLNRMSVNGGAYEGTGIWGFDPKTGHYTGYWADNGNSRIRIDDGSWDPATNTMTWVSEVEYPNGRKVRMCATSTFSGKTRTYRSVALTDAGEVLLSTVVFTRRAQPPAN